MAKADPPQTDKAEEAILKGIKVYEELKLKVFYALGYYYLGEFYSNTGQKDKALETLKTTESLFQEMEMDCWLAKTHKVLKGL